MNSRERVLKTLNFETPDRAPFDLWALAGVGIFRKDELEAMRLRFPSDMAGPVVKYGAGLRTRGTSTPTVLGEPYYDEWGCGWTLAEIGVCGEVKDPPLADWSKLAHYSAPWEVLKKADFSKTNESCADRTKFYKAGTGVRPFERMQFLRGSEDFFMDLAYQPSELFILRDMVHEYFLAEMELWAKTDVDAVGFMDDWGAQNSLLISPDLWRSFYKPLYKDYCDILKKAGKYIFFHSDGHIRAIYPDLVELGVNAVNSQLFCMDIEELGREFKGKITFWGEICRQNILPFGTVADVQNAVRRVRAALDDGRGGVMAQCEWGVRDPADNIAAVYETWQEPRK